MNIKLLENIVNNFVEKITVNIGGFGNSIPGKPTTTDLRLAKYNKMVQTARLIRRNKHIAHPDSLTIKYNKNLRDKTIKTPDAEPAGMFVTPFSKKGNFQKSAVELNPFTKNTAHEPTIAAHELGHSTDKTLNLDPIMNPKRTRDFINYGVSKKSTTNIEKRANTIGTFISGHAKIKIDPEQLKRSLEMLNKTPFLKD